MRRADEEGVITVPMRIDLNSLPRITDQELVMLWHVGQANPAPHGDRQAGQIVGEVTAEIVRRWLAGARPELYHHQPRDHYWQNLGRFARWDGSEWVPREGDDGGSES